MSCNLIEISVGGTSGHHRTHPLHHGRLIASNSIEMKATCVMRSGAALGLGNMIKEISVAVPQLHPRERTIGNIATLVFTTTNDGCDFGLHYPSLGCVKAQMPSQPEWLTTTEILADRPP